MKQDKEFYTGIVVWLLTAPIATYFWIKGLEGLQMPLSPKNIAAVIFLFILYLAGYFLSYGLLGTKRTRLNRILGLLISGTATAILSAYFFFFGMMGCMAMILIIRLASIVQQKWAMLAAIAVPAAMVSIDYWLGRHFAFPNIVVYGIVNVLALIASYRAIAEQKAKLKSEQLVRELTATQFLLSATTKRDERLRIARNLHDIMGHQLTALSLQLEVASHVEGDAKNEHIENARTISTSLLSNVRETVAEFRAEKDLNLHEALSELIQGIPNLDTRLKIDWDESLPDERQVEVLFRCAQEALTNVARHSAATRCDIIVSSDARNLTLVVRDNGGESAEVQPGNGLKGMAERVNRIDGDLNFESHADGFALFVNLPINDT